MKENILDNIKEDYDRTTENMSDNELYSLLCGIAYDFAIKQNSEDKENKVTTFLDVRYEKDNGEDEYLRITPELVKDFVNYVFDKNLDMDRY